jgi:cyclophilin family peptidyl-prolyl cis-trans isomerase
MGDINSNNGTGHISSFEDNRYIPDEINKDIKFKEAGLVAMANDGKDMNGSQFFITLDDLPMLDGEYTIIGHIVRGYEIVKKISDVCGDMTGKPKCDVKIIDTGIYNYQQYYSKLKI